MIMARYEPLSSALPKALKHYIDPESTSIINSGCQAYVFITHSIGSKGLCT